MSSGGEFDFTSISLRLDAAFDAGGRQPSPLASPFDFSATTTQQSVQNAVSTSQSGHTGFTRVPMSGPPYSAPLSDVFSKAMVDREIIDEQSSFTDSVGLRSPGGQEPAFLEAGGRVNGHFESPCPVVSGLASKCIPQRCGTSPPCLIYTPLPEIEECTSVPCVTESPAGSQATSIRESYQCSDMMTLDVFPEQNCQRSATNRKEASLVSEDIDTKIKTNRRPKEAHSLVERRYRENLNGKISQLHRTLLATRSFTREGLSTSQRVESDEKAWSKFRKSDVLIDAMRYIDRSEVEMRHMANEVDMLKKRVKALEKLVKCEDCVILKGMVNLQMQASGYSY